jgi:uncharacterized protein YeaO (DUF488 family)
MTAPSSPQLASPSDAYPLDRVEAWGHDSFPASDPPSWWAGGEALPRTRRIDVRLKRAYEPAAAADGYRVLIDRLWPRGVSRERARLDEWERELAPSPELRRWFGHDPSRFDEFRRRYVEELRAHRPRIARLRRRAREGTLTLVFSARDTEHNDAVVLAQVLRRGLPRSNGRR